MTRADYIRGLEELRLTLAPARLGQMAFQLRSQVDAAWMDGPLLGEVSAVLEVRGLAPMPRREFPLRIGESWLLLFDPAANKGAVARLQCAPAAGSGEAGTWFRIECERAARALLSAAARTCRTLDPPHTTLRARAPSADRLEVSGASLGLAAAVALVSQELGQPPCPSVAGSAAVTDDGDLKPVKYLPEKIEALRAEQPGVKTVVVAADQKLDGCHPALQVLRADRLEAALPHFGLQLESLQSAPIELHLARLARFRHLNTSPAAASDWRRLADQAWETSCALGNAGESQRSVESRAWSALFFLHAGDPDQAKRIVSGIDDRELEGLSEGLAWKRIVEATVAIDEQQFSVAIARAELAASACQLATAGSADLLLGYALGTLGRAHMHAGQFADADQSFASAIGSLERCGQLREVPRTMCYRATALRLAGRGADADRVVKDALVLAMSGPCSRLLTTTAIFLRLERARIRMCLGQWSSALSDLESVRDAQSSDEAYPRVGALRDLPLALWMNGRRDAATAALRTCLDISSRSKDILSRVAAIAAGVALVTPSLRATVPEQELRSVWDAAFPGHGDDPAIRAVLGTWVY